MYTLGRPHLRHTHADLFSVMDKLINVADKIYEADILLLYYISCRSVFSSLLLRHLLLSSRRCLMCASHMICDVCSEKNPAKSE